MATLVQVQTLRGTAGLQAAQDVVTAAIAKHNATPGNVTHTAHFMAALPPNVKGMQVQLSLLAALARANGATCIRLSVHNGNVAICGTQESIDATLAATVPTYNAMATLTAATYTPAEHGPRMGFTNGFMCGLCAGLNSTPATLAYGLGSLFSFPAPGNGTAYGLGVAAASTLASTPATPATPAATAATAIPKRAKRTAA